MKHMALKKSVQWEITPYQSLGPFRLGSLRESNRIVFPEFRAADRFEKERRDSHMGASAFVNYDKNDLAEFIEVTSPAHPVFRTVRFIGRDVDAILDDMADLGYGERWNDLDNAVLYDEIGLLISVSPSDEADGIALYKQGYWEQDSTEIGESIREMFAQPVDYSKFPKKIADAMRELKQMQDQRKQP